MPDKFKQRSEKSELIDAIYIPKELLFRNLRELDLINRLSGGQAIALNAIKKLVTEKSRLYHIVDLGCGSGTMMKRIADWARANGYKLMLTGVDRNEDVINYLYQNCRDYPEIRGVTGDYRSFLKSFNSVDIIHCSLFCHHLNNEELIELFSFLENNIKSGFVIYDLQRNRLAYYGVQIITHLLNGSSLAKNDGPVSILRAFKLAELKRFLQEAHVKDFTIKRIFPFRFLIVGNTGKHESIAGQGN